MVTRFLRVRFSSIDGVAKAPRFVRVKLRDDDEVAAIAEWIVGFYKSQARPVCTRRGWVCPAATVTVQSEIGENTRAISLEEAIAAELTRGGA